jgi:hypothetical protein
MKHKVRMVLVVGALALAALACQALGGGTAPVSNAPLTESTVPASVDEPTSVPASNVILKDDFSSAKWGTGTDADSAVEYVNETLNFDVFTEDYFVWSTPDGEDYSNVRMEVTILNNDTDSTTAFGFICNKAAGNDFHYLVMTPAGQYAIAVAKEGEQDVFLTNNDEWADSDFIAVNAGSYRVGAECGNGRLTLFVDGQQVASVADSTYTSGQVAVMVWSGEEAGMVNNVSFDDFVMTELE